jgi:valyl-tRNA synthetase
MNLPDDSYLGIDVHEDKLELPEKWILSRLQNAVKEVNKQLDKFHFNEAAKVIYEFVWSDYCDWYIEVAKTRFNGEDITLANTARAVSVYVLKKILALLHPYAPFITEELWGHFKNEEEKDLIVSDWPIIEDGWINRSSENQMNLLKEVISSVRTIRSSMNVPPSSKAAMIINSDVTVPSAIRKHQRIIQSLCNISEISYESGITKPQQSAVAVIKDIEIFIPLGGLIDVHVESKRLLKRKKEIEGIVNNIHSKLNNQDFLTRAPEHVVQKERTKLDEIVKELEKVNLNLEMMQ